MTGSGLVLSMYRAFLPMLVIKSLLLSGVVNESAATNEYGLLTGIVYPLLFFPGFFTQSLSTALIPAISEAWAQRNERLMFKRIGLALRSALYIGVPCTVILYAWATPLATVIYHAPEAGHLLKILAPLFLVYYFESPLYAVLLGLGKASVVMRNLIVANVLEAAAIFLFGSRFGIAGVAVGLGFGIFLLFLLNLWSVSSTIGVYFDARPMLKVFLGALMMAFCGAGAYSMMARYGFGMLPNVAAAIAVALLAYVSTLQALGGFRFRSFR
jgi:stage V sporulation protein B